MNKSSTLVVFISLLQILFYTGCVSDGTTVVNGTYTISITEPSADGASLGKNSIIGGDCGHPNYPIVLSGDVSLYSVCQGDNTWSAPISGVGFSEGQTVTINVQLNSPDYMTTSPVVTRTFTKSNVTCDNPANLTKLFGNIDDGADGSATPYIICTSQQFENIGIYPSANFELGTNINFAYASFNPIAVPFTGQLDGKDYRIENFQINDSAATSTGIFRAVSGATIRNIKIKNVNVIGTARVGILAGDWRGVGTIDNVDVQGTVQAVQMGAGLIGLANTNSALNISNSNLDVNVTSNDFAGGVISYVFANNTNFAMTNTNVYANVTGQNYVGGVIGRFWNSNASLTNVLHKGNIVSTGKYVGGIVGEAYHGVTLNQSRHVGSINVTRNSENDDMNVGGLVGVSRSTTNITDSHVVSNITMGGDYAGGLVGRYFGGTISNSYSRGTLTVDDTYYNAVTKFVGGLAGNVNTNSAIVGSYSLMNINSKAEYVGGLVGYLGGAASSIDNSYSTGTIAANKNFVGGLVGQFTGASLSNSFSRSDITITNPTPQAYIGGLVGYVNNPSTFSALYNSGNVVISNGTADNVGGGFGYAQATSINDVFNSGDVSGARNNVGGIAGYLRAPLTSAFSSGSISSKLRYVGGIAGIANQVNITDAFFTGSVAGDGEVAGIVGWYIPSATSVSNVYVTGSIYKNAGSTVADSSFGPIGGNITSGDISNGYYIDSLLMYDNGTTAPISSPNTFGSTLTASQLDNSVNYSGFNFPSDWVIPSGGFQLPFNASLYSRAVLHWMDQADYGFIQPASYGDDPINEADPEIIPETGSYESLASEFGQDLVDEITSSSAVSNVTVGNLEISIENPAIDNETIIGRMLVYGECGQSGNTVQISGSFDLWTICQSNNRWAAVIDADSLANGSLTLSVDMKNSSLGAGSPVVSRTLNKPSTVCSDSQSLTGVYGNSHLSPDGSSTPYIICHSGHFENIALNPSANFDLGADVDFANNTIDPITAEFTGRLDGKGFRLKNFNISKSSTVGVGLFKEMGSGAIVQNLKLSGFTVSGYDQVGSLAGKWKGTGSITNVQVDGSVTGIANTGGLVGLGNTSSALTITNLISTVNVTGNNFTGGVVGLINTADGSFSANNITLHNTITSTGASGYVGGFIGQVLQPNIAVNAITQDMNITATGEHIGGLIGDMVSGTISNCTINSDITITVDGNNGFIGGAVGRATASSAIDTCQFNGNIHAGSDNVGGIVGYLNQGTLRNITTSGTIVVNDEKYNVPRQYVGGIIGRSEDDFPVNFTDSSSSMSINANAKFTGGVAGRIPEDTSVMRNVFATGEVIGSTQFVGGLAGFLMAATIEDSYATGNVQVNNTTPNAYTGGLLGYSNSKTAVIKRVHATGNVTINSGTADYVGGLIGYFRGGALEDSYATGNITGVRNSSGGFIGLSRGTIIRSYSTGDITASGRHIGGFVGYQLNAGINDSFTIGNVEADDESGAFIGYVNGGTDTIIDSYAYGVISKASGSSAPDINFGPFVGALFQADAIDESTSYYMTENYGAGNNTLGSAINLADATTVGSYLGFSFGGSFWAFPSAGYQLPGESTDYTYPVLNWMIGGGGGSTYTVSGTLAGLEFDSLTITLNGSENITLNPGQTSFTFGTPLLETDPYSVTITSHPSAPAIICTVTNGSGTMSTANVNNVSINCPVFTGIAIAAGNTTIQYGLFDFVSVIGTLDSSDTVDLTNYVSWGMSPTGIFSINSSGKLTAVAVGSSTLTASYLSFNDNQLYNSLSAPTAATGMAWVESSPVASATINASWTVSVDALDSQGIDVYQNANCIGSPVASVALTSSANSYSYSGAISPFTYSFKIRSMSSGLSSTSACSNNLTIDLTPPNPIFNLSIANGWTTTPSPANSPLVFWANPSGDLDHVEIALGSSVGASDVVAYADIGTVTSHTFTNLLGISECTIYYPSVKTVDVLGNESNIVSSVSFQWDQTAPVLSGTPTVGSDALQNKSATSTWSVASENCALSHYEFAVGTSAGASDTIAWMNIGNVVSYQAQDGIDGVSLNLAQNTNYFTSIRAVDTSGQTGNIISSTAWQYFVPDNELPAMILWLDGQDLATIKDEANRDATDGSFSGNVDVWEDKSGSTDIHNFSVSASRPTFNASKNYINFNGTNQAMTTPNHVDINTGTLTEKNISFSLKTSTDISTRQVVYEEGGTVRGMNIYIDGGNLYCGFWNLPGGEDGGQPFVSLSTPISTNSIYHVTWVFDYSNYAGSAGPDGALECFVNGSSIGSAPSSARLYPHGGAIGIGRMDNDTYFHDGTSSGDGHYYQGDVMEVFITNDIPTAQVISDLYDYLDSKWGSVVSVPGPPVAASSLNFLESSPQSSLSFNANWVASTSLDVVEQRIELYDNASCSGIAVESHLTGNSSTTVQSFAVGSAGLYYYKVASVDNDGNETESICSVAMNVDQSINNAPSAVAWAEGFYSNSLTMNANWTPSGDSDIASQRLNVYLTNDCSGSPLSTSNIGNNSTNAQTVSGSAGQTYYFTVTAIDQAGNELDSNCSLGLEIDLVAPNAPSSIAWVESSPHTSTTMTSSWALSASGDVASQRVDVYSAINCSGAVIQSLSVNNSDTSRTVVGSVGSTYYFKAIAIDNAGNEGTSACSDGLFISSSAFEAPHTLSWVESSPVNNLNVNTRWTQSSASGLTGQRIDYYTNSSCSGGAVATQSLSTGVSSDAFSGLDGTNYYFTVTAIKSGQESTSICSDGLLLDVSDPSPIKAVSLSSNWIASASPFSSPTFSWTNPGSDIGHIEAGLGTTAGSDNVISFTNIGVVNSHSFSSLSLSECTPFYPVVKVVDEAGNESVVAFDATGFQYDYTVPADISGIDVSAGDGSDSASVTTAWAAGSDNCSLNRYEMAVSTSTSDSNIVPNGSWTNIGLTVSGQLSGLSLAPATNYYSLIRAVDAAGNVGNYIASAAWTITLAPDAIAELEATSILYDAISIGWLTPNDNGTPIVDYIIEYKETSSGTWNILADAVSADLTATVSGLTENTSYDFRVKASNGVESSYSPVFSVTTAINDPFFESGSYKAMNLGGATTSKVVAFEDTTEIKINDIVVTTLNAGQTYGFTSAQFDVIEGDKPIFVAGRIGSGGASNKGNVVWNTPDWAGKNFLANLSRTATHRVQVYAFEASDVRVYFGGSEVAQQNVSANGSHIFSFNTNGNYEIVSDGWIVAYQYSNGNGSNYTDPMPVLPSSKDIIGFPSNSAQVASAVDGAYYDEYHSSGGSGSSTLSTGTFNTINGQGSPTSYYQGDALRLIADQPIVSRSYADSNGSCSAPFIPVTMMKKRYAINVNSDYVAFASTGPAVIDVIDPTGTVVETITLTRTGTGDSPYRGRRGTTTEGMRFESTNDVSFGAWYQPNSDSFGADQDESIMFGAD